MGRGKVSAVFTQPFQNIPFQEKERGKATAGAAGTLNIMIFVKRNLHFCRKGKGKGKGPEEADGPIEKTKPVFKKLKDLRANGNSYDVIVQVCFFRFSPSFKFLINRWVR